MDEVDVQAFDIGGVLVEGVDLPLRAGPGVMCLPVVEEVGSPLRFETIVFASSGHHVVGWVASVTELLVEAVDFSLGNVHLEGFNLC